MVTLEVKVERSSNLRVEWSSEMGAEQSSDLEVGCNLEQQKCEMGCPLNITPLLACCILKARDMRDWKAIEQI